MKSKRCKFGRAIIATVVILAALVFVFAASSASALTIYVPTDYPTIQQAIDAASPGDTVFVYNGTYYDGDGVKIEKDCITLQGEDANTTTIHGKWAAEGVVYVSGDFVNVSGFTVMGSSSLGSGIYLSSGSCNCRLSRNNATDNCHGILLYSSSNNNLTGNYAINNNDCGIQLSSSSNNNLTGNYAINNYYYGIWLSSSSNNNLTGNYAINNLNGIRLYSSCNNNNLTGNSANNNNNYGIYLYSSCNNNNLTGNSANNNYGGIYLYPSCNNNLIGNSANNNYFGIYLYSSCNNNNLTGNSANNNNHYGIFLASSKNNELKGNTADANSYGIRLMSTSLNNNITKNTVSNSTEYGIYLDWSGENEIWHNNFINNNKQAYDHHGFNNWDKGPAVGGNYWSDHICHGNPSDGTEPYEEIDTDAVAVDNYPFEDADGWTSIPTPTENFDTGSGGYPSIRGNHTGTITPNHTVIATKMYTYPCSGTGGHTEYLKIWNSTWNATAIWDGYVGDWHNISFSEPFTLKEGFTYNYTIITGSYPQIHHTDRLEIDDGEITCAAFIDANGKRHNNWIPAIRLE